MRLTILRKFNILFQNNCIIKNYSLIASILMKKIIILVGQVKLIKKLLLSTKNMLLAVEVYKN